MNEQKFNELLIKPGFWSKVGPFSDTVLSTRIRLIRNVYGVSFSHRQEKNDIYFLKSIANRFIKESEFSDLELIELNFIDNLNKRFLRERNIITQNMETSENCFTIIGDNFDFNIMINDTDHFKIQVIKPGFQLLDAYQCASEVDDELNKFAIYAYADDFGFITSNSLNYGTGLKVSTHLHLPVLSITRNLNEVRGIVKLSGLKFAGLKEEGIKTFGNIYQLSSGITQGSSEREIIDELLEVTHKIINLESEARDNYFRKHEKQLVDKICRSYGILKYARRIGYVEAMGYLSDIRLGVILSIIKNIELQKINDLMVNMQWSHMQKIANCYFEDSMQCDSFRASYLRDKLEWSVVYG